MVFVLSMVWGNRSSKAENVPMTYEVPQTMGWPMYPSILYQGASGGNKRECRPGRLVLSADVGFTARCKSYVCCIVGVHRICRNIPGHV
jgi:hypothetical protein